MRGWLAVYRRELLLLRKRLPKLLAAWSVSPLLYLVAFGYAMGRNIDVQGHTYLEFLVPGLVAMTSMTQAFAISSEINIARFYWHIFEEIQSAPVSSTAYVTGEVLAGVTRALLAGVVILLLGGVFGVVLDYGPMFWLAFVLDSFVFASLAVGLAMLIRSHSDQALLNSFIITPMAFLGGTFFPLESLPSWAGVVLHVLPLTHASGAIRACAFGVNPGILPYLVLGITAVLAFVFAVRSVSHARD